MSCLRSAAALVAALALAVSPALATVSPTSPVQATTCHGGKACAIKWQDSSDAPSASQFGQTTIGLYVGSRYAQTLLQSFGTYDPSTTTSISPVIDPASGPNSNVYFIRFQSVSATDSDGYPLEAFSAKFTLDSMTGSFSDPVSAQIAGVTTIGSQGEVLTATGGAAATASIAPAPTTSAAHASSSSNSTFHDSAAAPSRTVYGSMTALVVAALALTMA